jgi:hypothetical protein
LGQNGGGDKPPDKFGVIYVFALGKRFVTNIDDLRNNRNTILFGDFRG